ncbi:amino acid adenylation domain-containing protein [Alteromonas sp. 76-1]|uniref:non-ribosomal peptide synthetase n=1 Tax=Alteromonas sp. 76-1 TaxID=2358187 RepID=UPI000FD1719C|nr:non-ribosomal peptide synthetase [Alteromonas sp. 76-1]VEL98336.1 amino acid adenylation domain-containing protein [Alteromonas sp. 76-1]
MKLTTNQQDILLEGKIYGNTVNNIGGYQKYLNAVDADLFNAARNYVVESNDSIGLSIEEEHGEMRGALKNVQLPSMLIYDFSDYVNAHEISLESINTLFKNPFTVVNSTLFEDALIKISPNEYWYYAKAHHVIMDGWGFTLLMERILHTYNERIQIHDQAPYPSFTSYIETSKNYHLSNKYEKDLSFWLDSFAEVAELPFTGKYELAQSSEMSLSNRVTNSFAYSEFEQIVEKASQYGVSFVTVFYTALYLYFTRVYNLSSLVIGTPVHNRRNRLEKNTIGSFVNVNAINIKCVANDCVSSMMSEIAILQRKSQRHSQFPLGDVVRNLKQEGKLTQPRLFDIHFNYQKLDFKLTIDNEHVETHFLSHSHEQLPLSFVLCDYGPEQDVKLHLDFNLNYFWDKQAEELLENIIAIVRQLISEDCNTLALCDVELVNQSRFQITNTSKVVSTFDSIQQSTFVSLFNEQVKNTPSAIAVSCGTEQLTYRDLSEKTNQLAKHLLAKGVEAEQFVGVFFDRSIDMLVSVIAILKAGGAYVPIDPSYPANRISYILKDTRCQHVLTHSTLVNALPYAIKNIVVIDEVDKADGLEINDNQDFTLINAYQLAYIIYTSGSTGNPKGVMIEHKNMMSLISWARKHFTTEELSRVLASTSICFDLSVFEMFVPLSVGGEVVIVDDILSLKGYSGKALTLINTVPSAIKSLLRLNALPSNLLCVNLAGELLKQSIVDELYQIGIPKVYDLYGPSEDTTYSTCALRKAGGNNTIGLPISGTLAYVVNPVTNSLVPVGVQGELWLGGLGVARGYLNRSELTAEKYLNNPWGESKVYKTGDLVKVNQSGELEYLGRTDSQCKVRGFRVEPGEIEIHINALDFVNDCSVYIAIDSAGISSIIAFLVKEVESSESEQSLLRQVRDYLTQKLPAFMIPDRFHLIKTIPLTLNGKVDKLALASISITSKPFGVHSNPIPPKQLNKFEMQILGLWQEIIPGHAIDLTTDIYSMGVNSLQLMKFIAKVETTFGILVDVKTMYSNNSIVRQCYYIEQQMQINELIDEVTNVPNAENSNCLVI